MERRDEMEENYEPTPEDEAEIENLINQEHERKKSENAQKEDTGPKNRISHLYKTESHWSGWLRIHGIKW